MDRVSFIDLPTHVDPRGALTAADGGSDLPFEIRRMFLLHDMPQGAARAAHAHRHLHEAIFAAHGGFRVRLDDGRETLETVLDRPGRGLYVGPLVWIDVDRFTPGAVCLVLASGPYDPANALTERGAFLAEARAASGAVSGAEGA